MAAAKKTLVIVESPSKAKTIGKVLGNHYKVVASVGHVRDLPKSRLGIELPGENRSEYAARDFDPQYIKIRGKAPLIRELQKEARNASKVYLATDPDREGEAISWHLAFLLGLDEKEPCRIVFNEITAKAIKEAVKNPRAIDSNLVDAQQARRVLDRLVGYLISPLLWIAIRRGLSAGRVQSAALKIICDREREIQAFIPEEYWNIEVDFKKDKIFTARLAEYKGKKLVISNKDESGTVLAALEKGNYKVSSVEEKDRARKPYPPFTTSSLQQDAANKLNFSTKKTMMIAQQLYEGLEIKGKGTVGLVSYIRTDSVRLSGEAREAAKDYIINNIGSDYYGGIIYSNKKKDVQDAHEAIRPSYIDLTPASIKSELTKDQYNLYRLIWQRTVASQMAPAKIKAVTALISNGDYDFKATGSKILFEGFLKVYETSKEDDDKWLPDLNKGEELVPVDIRSEQNFTQPPARFTEASLVKDLEEKEIGRPSTYVPIVATLMDRSYVKKEKKSLVPTDLGFKVIDFLTEYFKEIVDVTFTATMEEGLDVIESEGTDWKNIIRDYYVILEEELKEAKRLISTPEPEEPEPTGELCELCGKPMVKRHGRYGNFAACSGYPGCRNTKKIEKQEEKTGISCPDCGREIIMKKSRKGKLFYGCSGYPDCERAYWDKPTERKCPKCGSLIVEKSGKSLSFACSNKECDYKEKEVDKNEDRE
jgi:DNA topoisomerase-1